VGQILVDRGGGRAKLAFQGDSIPLMTLDPQQRLQIFCAVLRGLTSNPGITTSMAKPARIAETAVEITEEAIAIATSEEHFLGGLK
jgi:hypothetical protein